MSEVLQSTTPENTDSALLPRAGLALVAAAVANAVVWVIGDIVVDPIQIPDGDDTIALEWPLVVGVTAFAVVAAAIAAYTIGRFTKRPRRIFLVLVAAGTLASLAGPLSADLDAGNIVALAAMHVVPGLAAAVALAPTLLERRP